MKSVEVDDYPGYWVCENGEVIGKQGRVLKGKITWDGYREVVLSDSGRRRSVRVHRLVMECFVGECPEDMQVNHKDGNKLNNALSNLEYVSGTENIHHAFKTGLAKCSRGGKSLCDLSYLDYQRMIDMYLCGFTYTEICDYFELETRPDYIGEVLSGRKLTSLTGITEDIRIKGRTDSKKYSEEDIESIREMRSEGKTYDEIKEVLGISIAQISRILNGKRRAS